MMTTDDIESLFRKNYRPMLILANRLLHDEDVAKDIVHDVFASLLACAPESVTSVYLFNGVRFACMKHIRKLSTRERINKLYAADSSEIEEDEWPDEENIAKLNSIVESFLSEQTQTVLRLRFNERFTYKEIAERLGISEVAVYKHLRHAINVLRQNFSRNE